MSIAAAVWAGGAGGPRRKCKKGVSDTSALVACLALTAIVLPGGGARGAEPPPVEPGRGDTGVVVAPASLVVEGLRDTYAAGEPIAFRVRVPKIGVLRAETEILVVSGRATGTPIFREVKSYDHYSVGDTFPMRVDLPREQQRPDLTLLVRVTGLREDAAGEIASFEEHFTYNLAFEAGGAALARPSTRLPERLRFELRRYVLTPAQERLLDGIAERLRAERGLDHVLVEGHADRLGAADYNVELSRKRARSVVEHLARRGVPRAKIRHLAFGFSHPTIDIGGSRRGVGNPEDRRVELVVFYEAPREATP